MAQDTRTQKWMVQPCAQKLGCCFEPLISTSSRPAALFVLVCLHFKCLDLCVFFCVCLNVVLEHFWTSSKQQEGRLREKLNFFLFWQVPGKALHFGQIYNSLCQSPVSAFPLRPWVTCTLDICPKKTHEIRMTYFYDPLRSFVYIHSPNVYSCMVCNPTNHVVLRGIWP